MKVKTNAIIPFLLLASVVSLVLAQKNTETTTAGRFDMAIREDFFSGMAGDSAAFTRAMKLCEERLATRPRDPEAMVWHGAGLYFQASQAFMSGDRETGLRLSQEGIRQMDDAVQISPTIVTLIPRGAVLLSAAKRITDSRVREVTLKHGLADFERVLELDKTNFPDRCEHAKGELLGGLAEGWYRLGDQEKAGIYLKRIVAELPETRYAKAAKALLENKPAADQASVTCKGCHTSGAQ